MPQRTLAEAAQAVAALTETQPARVVDALRLELEDAHRAARDVAGKAHDERYRSASEVGYHVRDGLDHLRQDLRRLVDRAGLAETPSRVIAAELQALAQQQRLYRRQADDVARAVDYLRTIEADPVGWVDATLYEKFPPIRPQFTF